jgi:hypothetical protein
MYEDLGNNVELALHACFTIVANALLIVLKADTW